jgi:hypothetical protein
MTESRPVLAEQDGERGAPVQRGNKWWTLVAVCLGTFMLLLDGLVLGCFAVAAALIVAFVVVELRSASPMFDLSLFRLPAARGRQAGRRNDHQDRVYRRPEPHPAGGGHHRAGVRGGVPGRYPQQGLRG